ncbi:alpha/beta hydrolase family protein [Planctomicrobium sp. SH527]|uniref:alpha/beta hydrolase family protein n=1 Tax=Planctomicrobium sp. SH527 TaxID=3448123 RepID=UPI003F5AFB94
MTHHKLHTAARCSKFPLAALVLAAMASVTSIHAAEVSWLADVATVPAQYPAPEKPLRPVLKKTDGTEITNLKDWEEARAAIKEDWLKFLGPLPQAPQNLAVKSLHKEELENCTRELIEYEAEPGRRVQAFVMRPNKKQAEKLPGLVVFHGTTTETIKSVAGTGEFPLKAVGLRLAEAGYLVICPANFLWEEKTYLKSVAAAKARNPESLGMATMLADGMRAVDVLLTQPDVDPNRIGASGHSLGAKEVLYLMAFDERVRVGVFSEGGIGLSFTNWEAPWYLGPAAKEADFPREHHELMALIAPRPFLILGGETGRGCADGERSWPYVAVGQAVTKLYGQPARHGLLNHHEGHLLSMESQAKVHDWLKAYVADAK